VPQTGPRFVRLAAEFGTIVLGVFVALAGEAWLENRKEASQEAENLAILAEDLFAADTVLTRVVRQDSTFASMIREDVVALASGDTEHVLRLPLTVSEYRLRTGGLDRALANPGPVLEDSPQLIALLSELQAELRTVEGLNATMTAELFRYVQGTVRAQEGVRVAAGRLDNETLVEGLGSSPEGLSSITMVTVILQNRNGLHTRLQGLLGDVREALEEEGFGVRAPTARGANGESPAGGDEGGGPGTTGPDSAASGVGAAGSEGL
jgi:hypothetical protein